MIGFWIPPSGLRIPNNRIPDSKANTILDSRLPYTVEKSNMQPIACNICIDRACFTSHLQKGNDSLKLYVRDY